MELSEQEAKLRLRLAQIEKNEACQNNFLTFVKTMWPEFIAGRHHKIISEKLDREASGDHQHGPATYEIRVRIFLVSCVDDGQEPANENHSGHAHHGACG